MESANDTNGMYDSTGYYLEVMQHDIEHTLSKCRQPSKSEGRTIYSNDNKKNSFVTNFLKKKKTTFCNWLNRKDKYQAKASAATSTQVPPHYEMTGIERICEIFAEENGAETVSTRCDANRSSCGSLYSSSPSHLSDVWYFQETSETDSCGFNEIAKLKRTSRLDQINDSKHDDDEIEHMPLTPDLSLTSFVTAIDYSDEKDRSVSIQTGLRRRLSFSEIDDRCDSIENRSTASALELSMSKASLVSNEQQLKMVACNSDALLNSPKSSNRSNVCVKLRNNYSKELAVCDLTYGRYRKSLELETDNVNDDTTPLNRKCTATKSPSISQNVLRKISQMQKMTMSFVPDSSRSISIFV